MSMNVLVKKMKRSTICTKGKRIINIKSAPSSEMDICLVDDSNDSGLDADSRLPNPRIRNPSSLSDLDRDTSDDSIDSGIFVVNDESDTRKTVQEDNRLANLLCQSVSISEDSSEPPNKRLCVTKHEDSQLTNGTQINLVRFASENKRLNFSSSKTDNKNVAPVSSNQLLTTRRKTAKKQPPLQTTYPNRSKTGETDLRILAQPEEQHRARYMTEGSRGAVKDRRGSSFPTVKLFGYDQPVVLQVFIGNDQGKIQPHLFYQACKVSGKTCTPCSEKIIDGTTVIEISMLPENDMTVSCDCIGILKERNVDVEQRLPYFNVPRAKKKNTRCRMIFRVNLPADDSGVETLQVASSPILCTQPPGIPEICKKSIKECSVSGGVELFIIGKNFLKDTRVCFEDEIVDDENVTRTVWQEVVEPEKEYLHQTHLVCRIPPYRVQNISKPLRVHLSVQSGGKTSEPHTFIYLPLKQGLANDNFIGNYQNITSTIQGRSEFESQIPAVIQVPGTISAGNIPTILMSPTTVGINFEPNPNIAVSNSSVTVEDGKKPGQIHVLVVQQNENKMKRNIPISPAPPGRIRNNNTSPGRQLNRFGRKEEVLPADACKLLVSVPQVLPPLESAVPEQLLLKQEIIEPNESANQLETVFVGPNILATDILQPPPAIDLKTPKEATLSAGIELLIPETVPLGVEEKEVSGETAVVEKENCGLGNGNCVAEQLRVLVDDPAGNAIEQLMEPMKSDPFLPQCNPGLTPNRDLLGLEAAAPAVIQQNGAGDVLEVKKEKTNGDAQCDLMSIYQHSMTNALTLLSDSDLLSMINPSAFDNV